MQKISLVLAAVGLSASLGAFAALPTEAQPFHVIVPALKSSVEFTLEGLLFAPSVGDLDYGFLQTTPVVTGTNPYSTATQNPSLDMLGFRAAVGYIFANSGNDVQLAWTHMFTDNDGSSVAINPSQVMTTEAGALIGNVSSTGTRDVKTSYVPQQSSTSSQVTTADTYSQTKYDAIDLDVGQYLDIGTRLRLRMFGGLRAAQVQNNVTDTYTDTIIGSAAGGVSAPAQTNYNADSYTETDQLNSKFSGIGPRFGIDSDYHISKCFGLAGHFSGALLVGEANSSTTNNMTTLQNSYLITSEGRVVSPYIGATNNTFSGSADPVRVVPAFDAKLGLDYSYVFVNNSVFSIEAGYQLTQYINALDKIHNTYLFARKDVAKVDSDQNNIGLPPISMVSSSTTTSSIGFDGPYLSFNYKL